MDNWTNGINYQETGPPDPFDWFNCFKLKECLGGKGVVYKQTFHLIDGFLTEAADKIFEDFGFRVVSRDFAEDQYILYYHEDTALAYRLYDTYHKRVEVRINSTDKTLCSKLAKAFEDYIDKEEKGHGRVLILQSEHGSLSFNSFGKIDEPLVRENYTDEVLEGFDYMTNQIQNKAPSGRIVLLEGEPGTGKSFLIRGLINSAIAKFVFVPSNQVSELTSPVLIPSLISLYTDRPKDVPIVLVIEDADAMIVRREQGNVNILSTILNLGDGLMGHLLDVRMILSTNAKSKVDIDPALVRPGRLNTRIMVAPLPLEKAKEIYKRLTGKVLRKRDKLYTLAEIYGMVEGSHALDEECIRTFGAYL
jgi:ATP-dependent 26S proteasome regulatory subunit